jgi:hypothetical protein
LLLVDLVAIDAATASSSFFIMVMREKRNYCLLLVAGRRICSRERDGFSSEDYHGASVAVFHGRGRPLHLRATASDRPQGINNLQAFLPVRMPSGFAGIGSHLCAPSGSVPGGVKVDSDELWRGGEGARLDHVFWFYFKVLSAIYKGQFVIFVFLWALPVKCTSTFEEMKL